MLRPAEGNHFKCKCWVEILFTIAMLTSIQQVCKLNKCLDILFISKVISIFHLTLLQLNQRTRGADLSFALLTAAQAVFPSLGKVVVTENTRKLTMCVQILATTTTTKTTYSQIMANIYKMQCVKTVMFIDEHGILLHRVDPLEAHRSDVNPEVSWRRP